MFEAISQTTPQTQMGEATFPQGTSVKSSEAPPAQKSADILPFSDQTAQTQNKAREEKQAQAQQDRKRVTEEMLAELERDIETMHSVDLKFSKFDESGRTYVKIIDRTNDNVIREIPSEEALILAAKMDEMIGLLFDKRA